MTSILGILRCDILTWVDGDILAHDLIWFIEYSYQQGAPSFLEAYLERTSKLIVLGSGQFWDVWPTKKFPPGAWVRTKCTEKTCVGLWVWFMILENAKSKYHRSRRCRGCYKWYQSHPSWFYRCVWARGLGIWCMVHVGTEWSHDMSYDDTWHIDMAKRGGSLIAVDSRGHSLLRGCIVIS
jgi:hypothetical protein